MCDMHDEPPPIQSVLTGSHLFYPRETWPYGKSRVEYTLDHAAVPAIASSRPRIYSMVKKTVRRPSLMPYAIGQRALISFQIVLVSSQPSPGKKSDRCSRAEEQQVTASIRTSSHHVFGLHLLGSRAIFLSMPLSFHAEIHQRVLSCTSNG